MNENTLISKAFKESTKLHQEGRISTWATQITYMKQVLQITKPQTPNKSLNRDVDQILKSRFRDNWLKRMMSDESKNRTAESGNKLRTFRKFKNIYKSEPYLEIE
jgi:hypothetical protein